VENAPNAPRITSNLGLLAASLEVAAEFLADVWSGAIQAVSAYLRQDLVTLRDDLLGDVRSEQDGDVFLGVLSDLIKYDAVKINDLNSLSTPMTWHAIGSVVEVSGSSKKIVRLSLGLAVGEVQKALRNQGKPPLTVSNKALINQLIQGGHIGSGQTTVTRLGSTTARCLEFDYLHFHRVLGLTERPSAAVTVLGPQTP
jgi:hypothetical protein